jgi:hypothetical protein
MRKQIWIPCVLALAVCLLFLLWPKRQKETLPPAENVTTTNGAGQIPQTVAAEHHQRSNPAQVPASMPTNNELAESIAKTNPYAGRVIEAWQVPIEFYGKVVDENSNPVAQAQISFHWMEAPDKGGSRSSNETSDAEGLFSLHDAKGPSLSVNVSKDGYYTSRAASNGFTYLNGLFQPDSQNPVVFVLRQKRQGAQLLTSENGPRQSLAIRVPKDDTPVRVDLFQKQVSQSGQLEISQNKPSSSQIATNWSFRLSIPSGGFVENYDEFQFEAPDTNYSSTVNYEITKGGTNWATHVTKQFYILVGQPPRYGWLRFESDLAQQTVFITYAINLSGSRNLEPMELQPSPSQGSVPGPRTVTPRF